MWYNVCVKNTIYQQQYNTAKQGRFPVFFADMLNICDRVLAFDRLMEEANVKQYLRERPVGRKGRPGYNRVNMLKTVLYGFMEHGYAALRTLDDDCKVNLRYMYLMDWETPSYGAFGYFIREELQGSIEQIFQAINAYIFEKEHVDLQHLYIDGTKLEANANKYSFVWKKGTEKSRYKLFCKITALLEEINASLATVGLHVETNTEYSPESLELIAFRYREVTQIDPQKFVSGRGHRKSKEQRYYEQLTAYTEKLKEYTEKLRICGPERNSFSKTDHDATMMRMKKDYMGNDQLLPAYNVQIGIADEYIAVVDVQQYRSDIDCLVPLIEKFHKQYGFYPEYPVADAGYGSYNNYLYCREHCMKPYMKFPMYEKETKDRKYANDPFRAANFKTDENGNLICPNNRKMQFSYRKAVKGNKYGRQEEVYTCEDCSGCPYSAQCRKTDKNRTIRLNQELTQIHEEVLKNLNCIHGALLRQNRSIQAEGTFGIMKQDRNYRRIRRRTLDFVRTELYLVSIGHNLYKYCNKLQKQQIAA
jgi:transposase